MIHPIIIPPVIFFPPSVGRDDQNGGGDDGGAVGGCIAIALLVILLTLVLGFVLNFVALLIVPDWVHSYLVWINRIFGTVDDFSLRGFSEDGLIEKTAIAAFASFFAMAIVVISIIPFLAFFKKGWWKIPLFILLFWLFGGWVVAMFLPRDLIFGYLRLLDRPLGTVPEMFFWDSSTQGVAEMGFHLMAANFLTGLVVALIALVFFGVIGWLVKKTHG